MQITPRRHELISCLLLGIGTLFMYGGYHTQAFISETIIRSVHEKHPERISAFAGYYGQAIHYTAFAVSTLFTSSLLHYVSSKWILVLATILFSIYHLGFFYINSYFFYATQILMGLAYSLYNNGEGAYLAEHSSRRTAESNAGIETAVGHTSMFGGGLCLIAIFYFLPTASESASFRSFSELHIQVIYGTFFALSMAGVVIFALLPKKQQVDSIANNSPRVLPGVKEQFKSLYRTVAHPNMILLGITFFYMGLLVSFMLGIYPTALSFTSSLKNDIYIVALYAVFVGLAEMSGGLFVRPAIKRCGNYKLIVTMLIHVVVVIFCLIPVVLSTPDRATIEPTTDGSLILKPSRLIACVVGYLIGLADFTITMARAVICQYAIPESRGEVFSLTRLYQVFSSFFKSIFQCISSCIVLFLSPYLTITYWLIILLIGLIAGTSAFIIVVRRANDVSKQTQKTDESPIEENESSVV